MRQITDMFINSLDRLRYPPEKVSPLTSVTKALEPKGESNYKQKIPFIVWQTWKTAHLPIRIARTVKRFRKQNPEYTHYLMTDKDCGQFIRQHYGGTRTEDAYFRLNPDFGAARADFWRYCVLFRYGGVYLDIDSTCIVPLRRIIRPCDSAVLSQEKNQIDRWTSETKTFEERGFLSEPPDQLTDQPSNVFLQWLLIFEPQHPLLAALIERVTDAVLNYREPPPDHRPGGHIRTIYLTGPLRLTDTIWKSFRSNPEIFDNIRFDGIDYQGKALFQFPGHSDKDRQCPHYSKLSAPITLN